jgi:hypothetical protein
MGIIDTAKAFARVGAGKAGRLAAGTAAKGAHHAADAASKGAAQLNKAAGQLRDARTGRDDEPTRGAGGGGASH